MSDKPRLQWLRWWWPVLVWALLVTSFSTDPFSAEHTSRFIIPFLHWLFPAAHSEALELAHGLIRKCGHVGEYFILSLLLVRSIRGGRSGWRMEWAIAAVALAAGWAAVDEFHQAFVPSRGASMMDVLIDTFGATVGQVVFALAARRATSQDGPHSGLDSRARAR
ncbi:MAG TPA: VanZ family protein [Patescibacteria group bacterium]|nr:VanZ family protein [Patescibacteria group bacterium]